ncbi:MAG: flagellar protein FlgN [Gammaproteobacteria bacterium]|nr:flagellar protein FlgN [Gammaproteobacteria bacterium]MBU1555926.1 flagellar protein FlgN [Gammaproteobacteria bacterium]MBU2070810.1 flagellar protein FlgN [Gammaproteobacteria bacterium]MBU2182801.1 flagellar protein FlgN [Gammaproteobacteria bacterium]MBU2205957.1 flagellar protein FlgN [Gammaproteobacteria bacterium]
MSAELLKSFISSLQQDVQRLDQLSQLLDQQYELMSQRHSVALQQLNQQVLQLMAAVEHSHSSRDQLLAQLGLQNRRNDLQQLVSRLPAPIQHGTRKLLQELTLKSRLCQAKNEKNGKLLAAQRQLMQKLTGMQNRTSYPGMPL